MQYGEPWSYAEGTIPFTWGSQCIDARGHLVIGYDVDYPHTSITKENALRIVACVNACKDVSNEELEAIAQWKHTIADDAIRQAICYLIERGYKVTPLSETKAQDLEQQADPIRIEPPEFLTGPLSVVSCKSPSNK